MQFTCAVPLFRIEGKSTVTSTLKTANGISAFSMGTKAGEHFAFVDVWKWDSVDIYYHCIQKQCTQEQCWHQSSYFFMAVTLLCRKIRPQYINWYWLPLNQQCRQIICAGISKNTFCYRIVSVSPLSCRIWSTAQEDFSRQRMKAKTAFKRSTLSSNFWEKNVTSMSHRKHNEYK